MRRIGIGIDFDVVVATAFKIFLLPHSIQHEQGEGNKRKDDATKQRGESYQADADPPLAKRVMQNETGGRMMTEALEIHC
jgi:hypothetical protein